MTLRSSRIRWIPSMRSGQALAAVTAGASGSSGSKFVPGHIYTDANNNKARY